MRNPPKPSPQSECIMERLHHLAPHHWNKPETADCTIIIPVSRAHRPSLSSDLPDVHSTPCMTLRLHTAYLSANSTFFRGLFSGVSPLDMIQICASRRQPLSVPVRVPRSRLPRLLPSLPSHPVIFLPVPDASSIQPLLHWIYFGNTDQIEDALDQGTIQWGGLAHNAEYLGLSTDLKVFLGHWYDRNWLLPAQRSLDRARCPTDEGDVDSDCTDCDNDSDSDEYYSPSTPLTDDEIQSDDDCDRGRTQEVKPLVQLCGRLRLCTID